MATMILVEDESFERRSLMMHIEWELIGVQIIGEAMNGEQGLALTMELKPDIVLTDVSMPVMDGIEMARKIRAIEPETRILFLSAYDDFDYAKQAIDLNIEAYVMKPVNKSELLHVVKRTVDDITQKALEKRIFTDIKNSYSESVTLARHAFVNRILTGLPVNEEYAHKLNLKWLCTAEDGHVLMVTFFEKEKTYLVDNAVSGLDERCKKICTQLVNTNVSPGQLVTLFTGAKKEKAFEIETIISDFFEQMGNTKYKIVSMDQDLFGHTPQEIYLDILKRFRENGSEFTVSNKFPAVDRPVEANKAQKGRKEIADEVKMVIQEHYSQPLTLENIARIMHLTPNYIGSVFKIVEKMSVNHYLMQVRMEKACALLRTSSKTIYDIALDCGFGSITYFHSVFKKEFGITPKEYRENGRENAEV